jgi:outer membrane protein assembly factor BamE (lipoprotein component of BamABCDE complex)
MVMAPMTAYKAMPLSLAIMLATVMTCGSCSCTNNTPSDLNTFVGKDKDQVLQAMGKPQAEERYDNVILDPTKHSQAEIDAWLESTPSYGLVYKNSVIQFNVHDKVVGIKPK